MRDAACQPADPVHLLCLQELLLERLPLGDVLDQPVIGDEGAGRSEVWDEGVSDPAKRSVLPDDAVLERLHMLSGDDPA